MQDDLRLALAARTEPPALRDPLPEVRRRVARRRRRALGLGAPAAVLAILAVVWGVNAALPGGAPTPSQPDPIPPGATTSPPADVGKSGEAPPADPVQGGADADTPPGVYAVSRLVQLHPEAFVGSYRRADGTIVAVLGAGADEAQWAPRLRQAAAGEPFAVTRCDVTRSQLEQVRTDLAAFPWPDPRPGFAVVLRPQRCAVELQVGALPEATRAALAARFGDRLLIVTDMEPTRR